MDSTYKVELQQVVSNGWTQLVVEQKFLAVEQSQQNILETEFRRRTPG